MSYILSQMTVPRPLKSKFSILMESQTDRFSKSRILGTALHVEGLDLHRKSTQQDWFINGICHQPFWRFGNILRLNKISLTFKTAKRKHFFYPSVSSFNILENAYRPITCAHVDRKNLFKKERKPTCGSPVRSAGSALSTAQAVC